MTTEATPGALGSNDGLGRRCDLCAHWHYRYPSDMGICKAPGGPIGGVGFLVAAARAVLCKQDRAEFSKTEHFATTCDTWCAKWQCDGTEHSLPVDARIAGLAA